MIPWTNSDKIVVLLTTLEDEAKGGKANVNIRCPVCDTDSLHYDRKNLFCMTAWCSQCQQGFKQGEKEKL